MSPNALNVRHFQACLSGDNDAVAIGDAAMAVLTRCATHPDLTASERESRLAIVRVLAK